MKIKDILNNIEFSCQSLNANYDIVDIIYDSRKANIGTMFVCIKGFVTDGHNYASEVYAKGVRVFVAEDELELPHDATVIYVKDTRKFLALASANLFNKPAEKLNTIAITGTKGKTSISFMLKSIYESAGRKVGVIGSTGVYIGDDFYPTANSTPSTRSYFRAWLLTSMVIRGMPLPRAWWTST